ncbi:MAG: flagellar export chaperone FlgN [Planctomycetota bacterium]|jgi:hypothetical protein
MSASTGTNRVNRLVIAIREEVASHEKIVELLTVQEGSIRNPAGEAFQAATLELEVELKRSAGRTARRERALAELAAELGVAPGVATIGSMVERLGADGELLAAERTRLIEVGADVRRRNRRMATLVRLHRQVTRELIQVVLGPEDGGDVHEGGSLIDAEV